MPVPVSVAVPASMPVLMVMLVVVLVVVLVVMLVLVLVLVASFMVRIGQTQRKGGTGMVHKGKLGHTERTGRWYWG